MTTKHNLENSKDKLYNLGCREATYAVVNPTANWAWIVRRFGPAYTIRAERVNAMHG